MPECPTLVKCMQSDEIKHLHDTVFGNGKEGMDKQLVRIQENQLQMAKRLDDLMLWIRGVGVAVVAGIVIALIKLV